MSGVRCQVSGVRNGKAARGRNGGVSVVGGSWLTRTEFVKYSEGDKRQDRKMETERWGQNDPIAAYTCSRALYLSVPIFLSTLLCGSTIKASDVGCSVWCEFPERKLAASLPSPNLPVACFCGLQSASDLLDLSMYTYVHSTNRSCKRSRGTYQGRGAAETGTNETERVPSGV